MTEDIHPHIEGAEAAEVKQTPWWQKLTVVLPVVTGLLLALTGFLTVVLPLLNPQPHADAPAQQTPQITVVVPSANAGTNPTPLPQNQRPREARKVTAMVTTPLGLYMRSGPSEKTNPVVKLELDAKVTVSNCRKPVSVGDVEGQWCQAIFKDDAGSAHRGWVFNAYLNSLSDES